MFWHDLTLISILFSIYRTGKYTNNPEKKRKEGRKTHRIKYGNRVRKNKGIHHDI